MFFGQEEEDLEDSFIFSLVEGDVFFMVLGPSAIFIMDVLSELLHFPWAVSPVPLIIAILDSVRVLGCFYEEED